jgi:hypothetical protein
MATQAVTDHLDLARSFLARSKSYLAEGDLHQASEKGWGAASHIVKAVAAANDWEYEHHDQFDNVVVNASNRYRQPGLVGLSNAAHALHVSFYKRKEFIDAGATQRRVGDVESMVDILQPFID